MAARYRDISVFVLVQAIGLAASWIWQHASGDLSVALWSVALVLLIPGNFLAAWVVESSLWHSGLSLMGMGILSTVLLVAINALVWIAFVKMFRVIRSRPN